MSMALTAAELALLRRLQEGVTVDLREATGLTDKRDIITGFGRVLDTVKPENVAHMQHYMRQAKLGGPLRVNACSMPADRLLTGC